MTATFVPAGSAESSTVTGRSIAVGNLMSMIEGDFAATLTRFADLVDNVLLVATSQARMPGDASQREAAWREAAVLARHGAEVAHNLVQLAELSSSEGLSADERIRLADIVDAAARRTGVRHAARRPGIFLYVQDAELARIPGSRRWLDAAIGNLIQMLVIGAPPKARIALVLRQRGKQQYLEGTSAPGIDVKGRKIALDPVPGGVDNLLTLDVQDQLSPALARRIVELHGGMLTIGNDGEGNARDFSLWLPVALPEHAVVNAQCAGCGVQRQAEVFARDIGMLMTTLEARLKKDSR